jgi:tetratricopeptide (TPR) repeat protein
MRRFLEALTMNSKVLSWMILGPLLFPAAPRITARQSAASPSGPSQQSQKDAGTQPPLSPRDTQVERAKIFMAEKQYEDAIRAYQDLLKTEPKNAVFMNMIGIGYLDLSNLTQAKKYFERSVKADKAYSSAVNNLGMVWYTQKNYRRAIREYKRAVAIDPGQAGTHANLGFAYYNSNKFLEAATEFQKALEIDPQILERNQRVGTMVQNRSVTNHGQFFFTMARVYAQKHDIEHCADYLRKSLDEGYKDIRKVKTDPAFKDIIEDPGIQAVLALIYPSDQKSVAAQPGT